MLEWCQNGLQDVSFVVASIETQTETALMLSQREIDIATVLLTAVSKVLNWQYSSRHPRMTDCNYTAGG